MKYIDLNKQYALLKNEIGAGIQRVMEHGQFILGPEVKAIEKKLAAYVGVKHCIGVSSGTSALLVALMALEIGPGDEVITSPFSFFASAEVILLLGAKPVFVDIDPRTYNLEPTLLKAAITDKTKAIVPVSLYGQCADFDAINTIANEYNLPVIEDAAQSFGATYKGQKSGNLSTIAITSFFPSKPLGCYGEGGACFTQDDDLAEKMRMIMNHGQQSRYHHVMLGINARLSSIQAAVLLAKLSLLDKEIAKRQQIAAWYNDALAGEVVTPFIEAYNISAWAQYTIQVDDREKVRQALSSQGIPTAVHYPKGLHQQPALQKLFTYQDLHFSVTERAAERVLSLPFHPYMKKAEVEKVAECICKQMVCV